MPGHMRLGIGLGCLVLLVFATVDTTVMTPGAGLASLLLLRIGCVIGGAAVAGMPMQDGRDARPPGALPLWQATLPVQHLATLSVWPSATATDLAALALIAVNHATAPARAAYALAVGLGILGLHGLMRPEILSAQGAIVIAAGLAINGIGFVLGRHVADGGAAPSLDEAEPVPADAPTTGGDPGPVAPPPALPSLFAHVPAALLAIDRDGREHGRTAEADNLLWGLSAEEVALWLRDLPSEGEAVREFAAPAHPTREIAARTAMSDVDGAPIRLVHLTDRTALRTTTAALAQARRGAEIAASERIKRQAELAHELRTPLNGIFGFTQVLQEGRLTGDQQAHVARIRASAEEMMRAIDAFLGLAPAATAPTPQPRTGGLSVLVVEDDEVSAILARTLLERDGHRVTLAVSGREAVEKAAAGGFDVVLMDIRLPGFGGPAAARRIRALPDRAAASVPIVAMTANVLPSQIARYRAAGMVATVAKPIDRDGLRAVLGEVAALRSASPSAGPASAPPSKIQRPEPSPGVLDQTVLEGHRSVLGDHRLAHVIDSFLRAAPTTLSAIREAIADRDLGGLAKAAHKMGSGALTVGLRTLGATCRETERLAEAGEDTLALAEAEALEGAFGPGVDALERYLRVLDRTGGQATSAPSR